MMIRLNPDGSSRERTIGKKNLVCAGLAIDTAVRELGRMEEARRRYAESKAT